MNLFKKKKKTKESFPDKVDDKSIADLEAEANKILSGTKLSAKPQMPPPPAAKPGLLPPRPIPPKPKIAKPLAAKPEPAAIPTPSVPKPIKVPPLKTPAKPALTETQVAKLPLFMKVEEYDKIVKELNTLVVSLKSMDDILEKMEKLEEEESFETQRWVDQLQITKRQVRKLLSDMPETGRLSSLLKKKERAKAKKLDGEVKALEKELKGKKPKTSKTKVDAEVAKLAESINDLHDEMKQLHLEFKLMGSLSQLKQTTAKKQIKKAVKKPATTYKKKKAANPWE